MTGFAIRDKRNEIGLSQSKLADLTGIEQARISAYELGKLDLNIKEVKKISERLKITDAKTIQKIKKKRYQNSQHLESIIDQRPPRNYDKTKRNQDYLDVLKNLESSFSNPKKTKLKAVSFFAGCGGLCYGVKAAGFEIVATNELVEDYKKIYKLNFPKANFLPNDIQGITNEDIDKLLKQYGKIDLMVGNYILLE